MQLIAQELPLAANLIFGFLMLIPFIGTWLIIKNLARLREENLNDTAENLAITFLRKTKMRRILVLLAGIGSLILFFLGVNMTVLAAIIFGLLWIDSLMLIFRARQFISHTGDGLIM